MKGSPDSLQILSRRLRHFIKRNARGGIFADANWGMNTKLIIKLTTSIQNYHDLKFFVLRSIAMKYSIIKQYQNIL